MVEGCPCVRVVLRLKKGLRFFEKGKTFFEKDENFFEMC